AADSGAVRDQTVSDLGTTAADTSELSTADPAAFADEQGYDRGGSGEISAEDLAAARDELPAVRADIRAEAARIADEHAALLDAMGAGRGAGPGTGHLAFPDAGESWWSALNGQERERIRVNGYLAEKGATGAVSPDEVAQALADVLGRDTSQVAAVDPMMQWVQETRIADAARALANGRAINPDLYGGLDVNAIVESPYDLRDLFANKQIAAQHVAEVNAREAADEADRILGQTVGGPAPWEMTEAQYMAEVVQVDAAAAAATPIANDEWTGPVYSKADQAIMDRFTTLVPPALDDPTNPVSFEQMYREIIRTARIGGLV
ncbi:MAG: hypothetical protein ACRDXE_10685, partial [Acidimicrobiales bacterium]